jgi:predicted amidophosphoribosyltransferase
VLYLGPARPLLRAWKERGLRRASGLVADAVAGRVARPEVDVVTFVPPNTLRQLGRGHHPAVELAAALGMRWGIETAPLLTRAGARRRQTGLGRAERGLNVAGAFRAAAPAPARVVLVDDVYTTGATVSAAATVLKRAGASTVEVVTFARTSR